MYEDAFYYVDIVIVIMMCYELIIYDKGGIIVDYSI